MNKKIAIMIVAVLVILLAVVGIKFIANNKTNEKNIEGSLEELMDKMYANISEDEMPRLSNIEVTKENVEYYLGTSDIDFSEALASEPLMSSIAHSVVLVRLNDGANVEQVKQKIKENVNPAKWICVQVEDQYVKVANRGNLVALIMVNEQADKILENFNNL